MSTLRFPDVQRVLVEILTTLAGGAGHVGTETPRELKASLPFVRVRRLSGPSDTVNDYPTVDIDVFAALYSEAEPLAEEIREFLTVRRAPSPLLDRIRCEAGPHELLWGDGTVRRILATYTVVTRRRTPA